MRWAGHRMGEPHVLIWTVPELTFDGRISNHERVYRSVYNETYLNCSSIDNEMIQKWIDGINAIRPTLIESYVDAIYEVSRWINNKGVSVVQPRGIITSAGVLTLYMREAITQAFCSPELNRYGSREVSDVACSCGFSSQLHVNEFSHYVEVLDDDCQPCEPGIEGNIIVTLSTNYTYAANPLSHRRQRFVGHRGLPLR